MVRCMVLRIGATRHERVTNHAVWAGVGSACILQVVALDWDSNFSAERLSFDTGANVFLWPVVKLYRGSYRAEPYSRGFGAKHC